MTSPRRISKGERTSRASPEAVRESQSERKASISPARSAERLRISSQFLDTKNRARAGFEPAMVPKLEHGTPRMRDSLVWLEGQLIPLELSTLFSEQASGHPPPSREFVAQQEWLAQQVRAAEQQAVEAGDGEPPVDASETLHWHAPSHAAPAGDNPPGLATALPGSMPPTALDLNDELLDLLRTCSPELVDESDDSDGNLHT